MVQVKCLVLDILKPHQPNGLKFASKLAEQSPGCYIKLSVEEVDERTKTIVLIITGENIQFDAISDTISAMGAPYTALMRLKSSICSMMPR